MAPIIELNNNQDTDNWLPKSKRIRSPNWGLKGSKIPWKYFFSAIKIVPKAARTTVKAP